jgi:surface antigen
LAIGLGVGYRLAGGPAGQGPQFAQTSYYHDLAAADGALSNALENVVSGTPVSWKSPDGELAVKVTPVRTYRNGEDQYCREFQRELSHGQRTDVQHGLSCREGDGVWKTKYLILDAPEPPAKKVRQQIPG